MFQNTRWYNYLRMDWLSRFKPGVPKIWLQLTAGLIWTGVGIFLITLALEWIIQPDVDRRWLYIVPGMILSYLIYRFGFSGLAIQNSQRIDALSAEKPCIFAFQAWHSYPLVLFMIGLGITLRMFTPIPKPLLGILYLAIGGGLGSASLVYYNRILKAK